MARRRRQRPSDSRFSDKSRVRPEYDKFSEELRDKKSWTLHDVKYVQPLTNAQEEMFESFIEGNHVVAYGTAGTGKTFIGLYLAVNEILSKESPCKDIVIIRSAVQTREIGHMPGTLEEKISVFEAPYRDILYEIVGRASTYDDMKQAGLIRFLSTSFLRGITWSNSVIIVDEGQNLTFHEIHSIMTRLGENSVLIFLGDVAQDDLITKRNDFSGMERMLRVCANMENISLVRFTRDDIVRSDFVREWIIAAEDTP